MDFCGYGWYVKLKTKLMFDVMCPLKEEYYHAKGFA